MRNFSGTKIIFCVIFFLFAFKAFTQDADLFWKNGHKSKILSFSISPDNSMLLSVEEDTLAILWDLTSGQQLRAIKSVNAAVFRDNNSIYLAMADNTFRLVDLTGKPITYYSKKPDRYKIHPAFYPEEGYAFFDGYIHDVNKGFLRRISLPGDVRFERYAYSPKTGRMAISNPDARTVNLYDLSTGNKITEYKVPAVIDDSYASVHIKFSQDGQRLLAYNEEFIQLIDVATGKTIQSIKHGKLLGGDVLLSPDGKKMALVADNTGISGIRLSVIDIHSGSTDWSKDYKNTESPIALRFSPDNKHIGIWFTVNEKEQVYLLNAQTGALNWTQKQEDMSTIFGKGLMEFSPNGQQLVWGNYYSFYSVDVTSGKQKQAFIPKTQGEIRGIQFAKNNTLLTASSHKYVFTWNLQNGAMETTAPVQPAVKTGTEVLFAPSVDAKRFYVLQDDILCEVDTAGKVVHQYVSSKKMEYRKNVIVSYDGKFVANQGQPTTGLVCGTATDGEMLEVFDTKTHKLIFSKTCIAGNASFMSTKNVLVLQEGSNAKSLSFYELPSGKLLKQLSIPELNNEASLLCISASDRYLTVDGVSNKSGAKVIMVDLQTEEQKVIPVDMDYAFQKGDGWAFLRASGFTHDEKYMVYYSWRVGVFLFLDLERKRFDESLVAKDIAGVSYFFSYKTSPVGNYLLLGSNKGTIILYDYLQKKVKATLYPDAAANNWAIATPDGSFDGNEGAQAEMYHVTGNTVVHLHAVFEQFYKPSLLPRILHGEEFEPNTIDINSLKKAPVVKMKFTEGTRNLEIDDDEIQTVQTKIMKASMSVTAECPADGVTEIRLYQNGKLVETTRNLIVEDAAPSSKSLTKIFAVNLVEGINKFKTVAYNTQRTESKPVELIVQYKLDKSIPQTTPGIRMHLVVVGINTYKNPRYNLNYAQADAEAFKDGISKGATGIFTDVQIHYIKDAEADKAGIVSALEKVKSAANAQDVFVFYYAGHGVMNDKKEFYLVPADVTQLYGNDGALAQKGLSAQTLQQFSKDIKAQKQLYILDACQSAGALENIVASRGAAEEKAIAQLARSTGTHWLTASGSDQFASEFTKLGHGAFTYCILEALMGKADNGDKRVTVKEMDAYLQDRVPEITQQYRGKVQYPASYGYGNDFPLIIVK